MLADKSVLPMGFVFAFVGLSVNHTHRLQRYSMNLVALYLAQNIFVCIVFESSKYTIQNACSYNIGA